MQHNAECLHQTSLENCIKSLTWLKRAAVAAVGLSFDLLNIRATCAIKLWGEQETSVLPACVWVLRWWIFAGSPSLNWSKLNNEWRRWEVKMAGSGIIFSHTSCLKAMGGIKREQWTIPVQLSERQSGSKVQTSNLAEVKLIHNSTVFCVHMAGDTLSDLISRRFWRG